MKAVFEELNGEVATFIVDQFPGLYTIPAKDLPEKARVGDVFQIEIKNNGQIKLLQKLPDERKRREQSAKEKREELLKRNQSD